MVRDGAAGAGSAGRVPHSMTALGNPGWREGARVRASGEFGDAAEAALDVLELLERAWHDSHGHAGPPAEVVADVWQLAAGDVARLATAARLALTDRDALRAAVDEALARA